jgi:hypothetical protein
VGTPAAFSRALGGRLILPKTYAFVKVPKLTRNEENELLDIQFAQLSIWAAQTSTKQLIE